MPPQFGWENAFVPLAIGLQPLGDKHPSGDLKCVVEMPWLEKKLHSIDGIAHQPGVRLPSAEDFQEASDWPSTKGRFDEATLLAEIAYVDMGDREVVEESSCQLSFLRVL